MIKLPEGHQLVAFGQALQTGDKYWDGGRWVALDELNRGAVYVSSDSRVLWARRSARGAGK